MSLSSDVAREDTGRLAGRKGPAKLQPGLLRCGGITATVTLVAFKGIGCSRRDALLWNRQASIILDLVLSVCIFAACVGKASAESHDVSSTGFAEYAMNLSEDPLLKLREMTYARNS